ncbi:hypothetical protein EVAR_30089_1 [Eumeta japonica]|uniref:Uncharacterized protein n=1 Tax=Eumeta variegata TaxID=151549 RepID=A0A4C1X9U7_EUMVA|nr:hypothetical protein EVAR_30089_1 [Eumeta japonica]
MGRYFVSRAFHVLRKIDLFGLFPRLQRRGVSPLALCVVQTSARRSETVRIGVQFAVKPGVWPDLLADGALLGSHMTLDEHSDVFQACSPVSGAFKCDITALDPMKRARTSSLNPGLSAIATMSMSIAAFRGRRIKLDRLQLSELSDAWSSGRTHTQRALTSSALAAPVAGSAPAPFASEVAFRTTESPLLTQILIKTQSDNAHREYVRLVGVPGGASARGAARSHRSKDGLISFL